MSVWNWLKSLFKRGASNAPRFDVYSPEERAIYSYNDGEKIVRADPLTLYRKIMEVGPSLAIDLKVSTSTLMKEADKTKAHYSLLKQIREIFNLKSFEEGGLTELETVEILDHFMTYSNDLKKKQKMNVTLSNNSGVSPPYMAPTSPLMSNGMPSGSTENGSVSAEPILSTSEPPSQVEASTQV